MSRKNLSPFFIILAVLIGSTATTRLMAQPNDFNVNMLIGNYSLDYKDYDREQINRVNAPRYKLIRFGPNGIVTLTTTRGNTIQSTYKFADWGAVSIEPKIGLVISISKVDERTNKIPTIYAKSKNSLNYKYNRK